MDFLSIPMMLDILLIVMLAACIIYCVRLSRKLSVMRDAQSELHKVALQFDQAIVRSKLGIDELKNASESIGRNLQKEIGDARDLLEELKLINASSSRIADRLQDGAVGAGRQMSAASESDLLAESVKSGDPVTVEPRTDAERELLQMLTKSK